VPVAGHQVDHINHPDLYFWKMVTEQVDGGQGF